MLLAGILGILRIDIQLQLGASIPFYDGNQFWKRGEKYIMRLCEDSKKIF